jgi:N6-adenosine-specific RNA methylase IME4
MTDLAELAGLSAGAILADPPIPFKTWSAKGEGRSPQHHYSCPELDLVFGLPVVDIAAPDCFLFLWIPLRSVFLVEPLMNAWGFKFSGSAFVWIKTYPKCGRFCLGNGHTTRKNAEICFLGRRGKPKRLACDVRELIIATRREHSRKPDGIYERIERFCAGPYVELFARQRWPGWHAWGDQVDRFEPEPRQLILPTIDDFDPVNDVWNSVSEAYSTIRERKANGGPGWSAP